MTVPLHARQFQAMGCPCAFHVYGELAPVESFIEHALAEVHRFDMKYSRYRDSSVVSELNRRAGRPSAVDSETAAILNYAAVCFEASGGLFDITTGVYRHIWHHGMRVLPTATELDRYRQRVGWERVEWDGATLRLRRGMELDLGGVVKEYAADALATVAIEYGIEAGLINLGGDLRVIGPHPDGRPWSVGIANPDDPAVPFATTYLHTGAITTSGTYERYLTVDGKRYSHLIDPRSGWPVDGLRSVTVIADQAVVAGSLSTIASLMNGDAGLQWLHAQDVPYFAMDRCGGHHSHAQVFRGR